MQVLHKEFQMSELMSFSSAASMSFYHLLLAVGVAVIVGGIALIIWSNSHPRHH
jgi:predicted phage tail protein